MDTGSGAHAASPILRLYSPNTLLINNFNYTVPVDPTTPVTITISGIRVAVANLTGGTGTAFVTGSIAGTGVFVSGGDSLVLALPNPSLLSTVINSGIPCASLPTAPDFAGLEAAGALSATARVTEGIVNGFVPKNLNETSADTGVRILVKLSGFGPTSRVFVPDAIVGSTGDTPTLSGAFSTTQATNPGTFTPGRSELLLMRIAGADATGAGGQMVLPIPATATTFTSVSELVLTGGSAYAVYEVADSNTALTEFAQIPVFAAITQTNCSSSAQGVVAAQFAPVSNVAISTSGDPIPRFLSVTPGSDCLQIGDCGASFFPRLQVDQTAITLSGASLGGVQRAFLAITNGGSGQIVFSTSIAYTGTGGWLSVSPKSGTNNTNVELDANPASLQQGVYQATLTVNAGSAGTATIAVTFNVGPPGVTIQAVVNAANPQAGVAPASFASLYGVNLAGANVQVMFSGFPATVVYDGATQINLLVPAAVNTGTPINVVAVIDGKTSNTFQATLAANAPAVFNPGILNQDNTVNLGTQPASRGDYIQIFMTGLSIPIAGPVTVNIGAQFNLIPVYAGAVASIPGLEQVNVQVPQTLTFTGTSAPLAICIPGGNAQPLCSPAVNLLLK